MLHMVYFAHIYSQISYGIIVVGLSSPMRNVFISQERAIRITLRLGPRSSGRVFQKIEYTYNCLFIYFCLDATCC
jgi:hypothetical protein